MSRWLLCALASLFSVAVGAQQDDRANHFNDPFLQATDAMPIGPKQDEPKITFAQWQDEAHWHAEPAMATLGKDRMAFLGNVYRLLAHDGIFFVCSLCARGAEPVSTQRAGQAYRFVPSVEYLLQELDQAQLAVVDWDVQERDGFHHIHVFAKKGATTKALA